MHAISLALFQFPNKSNLLIGGQGQLDNITSSVAKEQNKKDPRIYQLGFIFHKFRSEFLSSINISAVTYFIRDRWKELFGLIIIEVQACCCMVVGFISAHIPSPGETEFCFTMNKIEQTSHCMTLSIEKLSRNKDYIRQE